MADNLDSWWKGRQIQSCHTRDSKLQHLNIGEWCNIEIQSVYRMAKWIVIDFGEWSVFCHCRMTGQWIQSSELHKSCRLWCILDDGSTYQFVDQRRFGVFEKIENDQIVNFRIQKQLGSEIWPNVQSGQWFQQTFQGISGNIKQSLLRQDIIVGIGNILASEMLFESNISPFVKCPQLTASDWERFAKAVPIVIERILEGERGDKIHFLHEGAQRPDSFYIYGRQNQPCIKCDADICMAKIHGRATFYCPFCQSVGD